MPTTSQQEFDANRQRSQSPIRQIEQEQNARLEATLNEVLSNTPALSHASIVSNPNLDTAEKLFRCLDQDRDGLLKKSDVFTFASATGFDPSETDWDSTYSELCEEYGLQEHAGLDLDHFRGLCNAYLAHDCYETAINNLLTDLEATQPAPKGTPGKKRRNRSRLNSELENFSLDASANGSSQAQPAAASSSSSSSPATEEKKETASTHIREESKEVRRLRKKVREIERIEGEIQSGKKVEAGQREKVKKKQQVLEELQTQLFAEEEGRGVKLVEAPTQSPSHKYVERRRRDSSLVEQHETSAEREKRDRSASPRNSANRLSGNAQAFVPVEQRDTVEDDWRGQMGTGNYEEDQEVAQYNRMLADAWRSGGYSALSQQGYEGAWNGGGMPIWYGNANYSQQYGYGASDGDPMWQQQQEAFRRSQQDKTAAAEGAKRSSSPRKKGSAKKRTMSELMAANFAGGGF